MSRARPPWWVAAIKVALAGLLVTGALFPQVGGFEGKGMAYRLPVFLLPALVVPVTWWVRGRRPPYPVPLDVALTVPFLLDTLGNALGIYDRFDRTDDVLHALNWVVLAGGLTLALARAASRPTPPPRWYAAVTGAGVGALAIVLWEAAEYAVMEAGVGGLELTYGDTIGDLLLSSAGGAVGAVLALRIWGSPAPTGRSVAS